MRAMPFVILAIFAFLLGSYVDHAAGWPFGSSTPNVSLASFAVPGVSSNAAPAPARMANPAPAPVPVPTPSASPAPSNALTYVPHYSNDQGLQDAPRAEVMEGRDIDMKRCVTTLVMRRVPQKEAQGTCEQMFGDE